MMPNQGVLSTSLYLGSGELLAAAERYKQMGRWPLPIALMKKRPWIEAWTELRLSAEEIERYFGGGRKNIGILLGKPSDWTVDIDLDCDEAVKIAGDILPTTKEVFGRPSKPRSHYIYRSPELTTEQFQDIDRSMIVEIRSTGGQTVFPPSVHESGEEITWASEGEPTEIPAKELRRAVSLLAVTVLLVRHWPSDGRHKLALTVSAVLARAGYEADEIAHVLELICSHAGDEKTRDRVRTARYAPSRIESGKPAYGIPTITELLGKAVADKVRL
jgi:putative DNA primase/helicase